MNKPKVYVTRQLFDEALEILRKHAEVEIFEGVDEALPRDLLLSKVKDVEGLLCLLTEDIDIEVMEERQGIFLFSSFCARDRLSEISIRIL